MHTNFASSPSRHQISAFIHEKNGAEGLYLSASPGWSTLDDFSREKGTVGKLALTKVVSRLKILDHARTAFMVGEVGS